MTLLSKGNGDTLTSPASPETEHPPLGLLDPEFET